MTSWIRNNRGFLLFLLCLGVFRTAIADWNPVPSGSMRPTILEGDVVFVNRLAYDLKVPLTHQSLLKTGEPQRGDIVTFESPKDGTRLIKRLVAIPGDVVEVRAGVLRINGTPAQYTDPTNVVEPLGPGLQAAPAIRAVERLQGGRHAVQYFAHFGNARTYGPVAVPAGSYFMLGDNRDNSEDSRYIGFVRREQIIGKAERSLVSADVLGNWMPRWQRIWARLD